MIQIAAVVLGFVLTGLVGNRLLQQWQHRSWLTQQQFLGHQKEYEALKLLSEELAAIMGSRVYHMRRLAWATRRTEAQVDDRLKSYDAILTKWNESLTSFLVRLTFYADYGTARTLEVRLQTAFTEAGAMVESLVRRFRSGSEISLYDLNPIGVRLNSLQGEVFRFNRDMLRVVEQMRERAYFGERIPFNAGTIRKYSNWELIQALFVRDVDRHSIFRAPPDPRVPFSGG